MITEKPGRLRICAGGALSAPVEDVPQTSYREREAEQGGLLDVAVDPDFGRSRRHPLHHVGRTPRFDPSQDPNANLGKIVRINTDGSIPKDNPNVGPARGREDIWTMGHRNMLAIAHQPSGHVWVFEMGPLGGDELNMIQRCPQGVRTLLLS